MAKKLKSTAIVDEALYIEREADRQLAVAIDDMGRPPYILVARQMGKTNLLFNAKRKLCGESDAFVYIDLSNKFGSERECFRDIINTAMTTHDHLFSKVVDDILAKRTLKIAPHKEHEFELRQLLSSMSGKLVILLDEIDSLTNCGYSDQIFAQIRSTYFSRINFHEFNRLTYVISGVAEPNEIIKDKNISPFNIGEKIYLDDFSRPEYLEFINKSQLSFPEEVVNKIFEWANGNPRITWDICSEVEANQITGIELVAETVDKAVKKLYLTEFDKAPVDHIRDLVEANSEIRDAIIQINYSKGSELSDEIKKKLYLAGIIKAGYESADIKVKNKVILECLSESWLQSLEIKHGDILQLASEKSKAGNYLEAAKLYVQFIQENPEEDSGKYTYHDAGMAYYDAKEYKEALSYFEKALFDKQNYAIFYYNNLYYKGLCNFMLNNYEDSIKYSKEVYELCEDAKLKYYSALTLAGSYQKKDSNLFYKDVVNIYKQIHTALASTDINLEEKDVKAIKNLSLFNLSHAYTSNSLYDDAKISLKEVLKTCDEEAKPQILLQLYRLEKEDELKLQILEEIKDVIINGNLELLEPSLDQPLRLTSQIYIHILIYAYSLDSEGVYSDLYDHGVKQFKDSFKSEVLLLYSTAISAMRIDASIAKKLLEKALDTEVDKTELNTKYECYKSAFLLKSKKAMESDFINFYFQCISNKSLDVKLTEVDTQISHALITECIKSRDFKKALSYIDIVKRKQKEIENSWAQAFYFNCYEFMCHQRLRNKREEFNVARSILELAQKKDPSGVEIGHFNVFLKAAKETVYGPSSGTEKTKIKRGRNERVKVRYQDGSIIEGKFKKFEADITLRRCEIVPMDSAFSQE